MAAWRSMGPDWIDLEPDPNEERQARLEALLDERGVEVTGGWYEDWNPLPVEPGVTSADGQVGTDALTGRAAA